MAVARALVNGPAVLLLDEPLGALDLKLRKRLQLELAQIHREVGTIFVYVTHDQEEALALSDRVAVMRDGRIEQVGPPREIYLRPRSRFVADFIGESNFISLPDGVVMVRPEAIRISADEARGRADPRSGHPELFPRQLHARGRALRRLQRAGARGGPRQGAGSVEGLTPGRGVWLSWDREAAVAINDSEEEGS